MKKNYCTLECSQTGKILNADHAALSFLSIKKNIKDYKLSSFVDTNFSINFLNNFFNIYKKTFICFNTILNIEDKKIPVRLWLLKSSNEKIVVKLKKIYISNLKQDTLLDKIMIITRFKFLLGSFIPFLFAAIMSYKSSDEFNFYHFFLTGVILILFHICANTFNDYFDWISDRDKKNNSYIPFNTGGSRSIELGLISIKSLLYISIFFMIIIFIISLYFIFHFGYKIIIIGMIAVFSVYFYSAPPIHLASRKGLGELVHVLCLGPLIVYGTKLVISNNAEFSDLIFGLPFGLMITSCLIVNEYPDYESDKKFGKINIAVILNQNIKYLYILLVLSSIFTNIFIYTFINSSGSFLLPLLMLPVLIDQKDIIFNSSKSFSYKMKLCEYAFVNYMTYSILYIVAATQY